jgi:hypothetical protein
MIHINVRAIVAYLIFFIIVWYGHPAWIALAVWLVEHAAVRWMLAGFVAGCFVPISIGWNMALRHRRGQAIEKAEKDYQQDRKKVLR